MHKWIVILFAGIVAPAGATVSQATPLMSAGQFSNAAAAESNTVLVHHRRGHVIKVKRHRHYGWVRGKHKGWSHSRHHRH